MRYSDPVPTTIYRTPARRVRTFLSRAVGLLLIVAAVVVLNHQFASSSSPPKTSASRTVFDQDIPEVANLDSDLLGALRQAATDARRDRVRFVLNSGWRSPEHQQRLLDEAVSQYGSMAEAARWVATPETSPHVSGDAVDIGPSDADAWLSQHGSGYGLCQIYENEPWHYELRPEAIGDGCPPMYADPTQDPRMQQRSAHVDFVSSHSS